MKIRAVVITLLLALLSVPAAAAVFSINRGARSSAVGVLMTSSLSSGHTSDTSDSVEVHELHGFGVQVDHTGADLAATLVMQESNDDVKYYDAANIHFSDISSPGGEFVDVTSVYARYVRFKTSRVSGTGSVVLTVHAKD